MLSVGAGRGRKPPEKCIASDTDCTGLRMSLFQCQPPTALQLDWEMEVNRVSRDRKGCASSWSNFAEARFLPYRLVSNQSRSFGLRGANSLIFSLKQFPTTCRAIVVPNFTLPSFELKRRKFRSSLHPPTNFS